MSCNNWPLYLDCLSEKPSIKQDSVPSLCGGSGRTRCWDFPSGTQRSTGQWVVWSITNLSLVIKLLVQVHGNDSPHAVRWCDKSCQQGKVRLSSCVEDGHCQTLSEGSLCVMLLTVGDWAKWFTCALSSLEYLWSSVCTWSVASHLIQMYMAFFSTGPFWQDMIFRLVWFNSRKPLILENKCQLNCVVQG